LATAALLAFDVLFLNSEVPGRLGRHLPLGMLAFAGGLSFAGFAFFRFRERLFSGIATFWLRFRGPGATVGERLLIIGAGNNSQFATWLLTHSDLSRAFTIVGIVDDDPRKQGMYYDGYQVLGSTRDLPGIIQRYRVGLVLFTISNISEHERHRILRMCNAAPVQVVIFPDVIEELSAHFFNAQRDLSPLAAPGD
jgi:FlaA1/EpsC-like NDP-sugar epimerase